MLIKAKSLTGFTLEGYDGEIGKVKEFYFDDTLWTIRYLIAATGTWLTGRQVLIAPHALGKIAAEDRRIVVNLTRVQIENSPPIADDKPVTRQLEGEYYSYYRLPPYWYGSLAWGADPYPNPGPYLPAQVGKAWDAHLRSTAAVAGYHIEATDGSIGHVEDFIIDDETWSIRYLVIKTSNWLPGKKVLVAPKWIRRVNWSVAKVYVDLPRVSIQNSPEYSEAALLTRDYETGLHQHYNRQGYWDDESAAQRTYKSQ